MSTHPPEGDADFQKSDRSARLLRTLRYVEAAGEAGIRPEDLAKKLGVSRRTAYRDLQALEASVGVPVWNNLGRWGVSQEGLLPELRLVKTRRSPWCLPRDCSQSSPPDTTPNLVQR